MAANAYVIGYSTDDGFKYYLDIEEKTAELDKFSGSQKEVVIPENVTYNDVTYSVTSLGDNCFKNCTYLTSIDIPSSVTSLGDACFYYCKSLTSIDIPSSVTGLGTGCFASCSSLKSITVDKNNKVYDSRDNCNAIIETSTNTMIQGCKTTVIPSSVTSLGSECFNGFSSLTSIDIPSSVTSLESSCFSGCSSLTSITIPSSVTSLGYGCFSGCSSLTSITIPSSVTSLGYYCFYRCSSLMSITIPSSVTSLGLACFSGCSSLTSIAIPSSVTSLRDKCFNGCSSLTSIDIPSSVTSLGRDCFMGCSSLTSIDIPSSVKSLGNYCFASCPSLESITVDKNNKVYDSRDNCNAIIETSTNTMIQGCKTTVIPSSVTSLRFLCFYECSSLMSVTIPSSVTSLGDDCFRGCSSLTSITIPSSVTSLGLACFSSCPSLESITVDKNNKVYDSRDNCNAIIETSTNTMIQGCKTTVIPSSVTSLEYYCFAGCSSLTSIDIPYSVTFLGNFCFTGCSSLTSVTIPTSVTRLGESCFYECSSLKTVTCVITTPINGNFFHETPIDQATLYVPEASLDAYKTTSPWSDFGTILPLEDEMISISVLGIATYCSNYDLDFTGIEGIKAYVATGYDYNNGSVLLTRVYKVPSGTGFIAMGDEGIYSIPHVNVNYAYANLLVGTTSATELSGTDNGYSNYILADGDEGVKFYISEGGTLAANKAYLHIPTSTSARCRSLSMTFSDDSITTGTDKLEGNDEKEDTPIYNLNGHRVTFPKNGIYIKNGKTIIIK